MFDTELTETGQSPIPFGGWTDDPAEIYCSGGHPGGRYLDECDRPRCPRCARLLDLSLCGCGTSGHEHLSRSFCPVRIADDQRAVHREPAITARDNRVITRAVDRLTKTTPAAEHPRAIGDALELSDTRARALLDGELALTAPRVAALAELLHVSVTELLDPI